LTAYSIIRSFLGIRGRFDQTFYRMPRKFHKMKRSSNPCISFIEPEDSEIEQKSARNIRSDYVHRNIIEIPK